MKQRNLSSLITSLHLLTMLSPNGRKMNIKGVRQLMRIINKIATAELNFVYDKLCEFLDISPLSISQVFRGSRWYLVSACLYTLLISVIYAVLR